MKKSIAIEIEGIDPGYGLEAVKNNIEFLSNFVGTTAERPTVIGVNNTPYFDTDLNKPIWFNGTEWVDGTGTAV